MSFQDFQDILNRIKDILIQKPNVRLFIEDIARAAGVDVKTAEQVYDVLLDIDAMVVDVEIDREIRGKYIEYIPGDDDENLEGEDGDDEESDDLL